MASVVYVVALLVVSAVYFVILLFAIGAIISGIASLFEKKTPDDEYDYGPVLGAPMPPIALRTKIVIGLTVLLAAAPPLPLAVWTCEQLDYHAPWQQVKTPDDYARRMKEAQEEYQKLSKELSDSIGKAKADHDELQKKIVETKAALEKLQAFTDSEKQAISQSGSSSSWTFWFGWFNGVSQSVAAWFLTGPCLQKFRQWQAVRAQRKAEKRDVQEE